MTLLSGQGFLPSYELNSVFYLSILCFLSILFVFKVKTSSKLNLPPSPPKIPFIGNLHQLGTLPHRSFRTLSQKYGPLMLLHLGHTPTLVVSSAHVVREISKAHDAVFSNRPKTTAAQVFLYGNADVAFAPYGEEWRQKRKMSVLELLSHKRVKSFQFIRVEEVAEMIGAIREECNKSDSPVNVTEFLVALSNNVNARCIFGQKYDSPDGRISFGELGRKILAQFSDFCVGDYYPWLSWVDTLTGQIPKFKATLSFLDSFFDQVIEEHKAKINKVADQSDRQDFMEILLKLQQDGKLDFELTQENLKAILVDMFIGASDTSSTALEWAMAEIMRNPNIMEKAQQEVRKVVGYKTNLDENDMKKMNYLKCIIKETLRLHPPVPLLVPRETTAVVKLRGYDIPAKIRVILNAWAIQRDPEFWDKAEEFLPERFENSEVDFKGHDVKYIPFGIGRRGCPGIAFGTTLIEHALANLLYWFDWKLPKTGEQVQDIDMSERCGITVNKKVPLLLQPIPFSSRIIGSNT